MFDLSYSRFANCLHCFYWVCSLCVSGLRLGTVSWFHDVGCYRWWCFRPMALTSSGRRVNGRLVSLSCLMPSTWPTKRTLQPAAPSKQLWFQSARSKTAPTILGDSIWPCPVDLVTIQAPDVRYAMAATTLAFSWWPSITHARGASPWLPKRPRIFSVIAFSAMEVPFVPWQGLSELLASISLGVC